MEPSAGLEAVPENGSFGTRRSLCRLHGIQVGLINKRAVAIGLGNRKLIAVKGCCVDW